MCNRKKESIGVEQLIPHKMIEILGKSTSCKFTEKGIWYMLNLLDQKVYIKLSLYLASSFDNGTKLKHAQHKFWLSFQA